MLHHIKSLDDLKEVSIRVDRSMEVRFPTLLPSQMLDVYRPFLSEDKRQTFCELNNVITFIDDPNDAEYIVPSTRAVKTILNLNKFHQRQGIVPLCNGDVPNDSALCKKWQRLMADRIDILRSEFMEDSRAYCYEHHITDIPMSLGMLMMEIPECGFGVTTVHYSEIVRPPISFENGLTPEVAAKLGTYATRNDVTIFINQYGRCYLTHSKYLIDELKRNGYQLYQNGMNVPLSSGEAIMSADLAARWYRVVQDCATYDKKCASAAKRKKDTDKPLISEHDDRY